MRVAVVKTGPGVTCPTFRFHPAIVAQAAATLGKPSSAARALFGGAEHIERVDSLVRRIARQRGLQSNALHEIVALVDERLARNRGRQGASRALETFS